MSPEHRLAHRMATIAKTVPVYGAPSAHQALGHHLKDAWPCRQPLPLSPHLPRKYQAPLFQVLCELPFAVLTTNLAGGCYHSPCNKGPTSYAKTHWLRSGA